ncbi:GNAT family N-acetyltransferase [Actinoplanes aureus]|uniref:GNAT family N-acetyltransferase n=1 Tax=Actinoplanes aureus TaxID=2792083 RepID=A0A931C4S4_9ACTN|nr:GNAT family N-acetyltransferase [Actinoplanes aureus]MBG0563394.1 GNAT family N-acetyltransferase [Actinoplanes aureus]
MGWQLTTDVERFAEVAGDYLRSEPVRHTTFLTVLDGLRQHGPHAYGVSDPIFGWWSTSTGEVGGVLSGTPPYPIMFSAVPNGAVPAAVKALAGRPLTGVNLLADDVDAFVSGWCELTGATPVPGMRSRLYRLDRLIPPEPMPPGAARRGTVADRPLLIDWFRAFHDEIGEELPSVEQFVDDRLSFGGVTLWAENGTPTAMAVRTRTQAGMARVQYVYTPAEHRRRGFGGAATTAATQAALDDGATEVVLFTDLANPTSNALYQRLGYRPIEDRAVVHFP